MSLQRVRSDPAELLCLSMDRSILRFNTENTLTSITFLSFSLLQNSCFLIDINDIVSRSLMGLLQLYKRIKIKPLATDLCMLGDVNKLKAYQNVWDQHYWEQKSVKWGGGGSTSFHISLKSCFCYKKTSGMLGICRLQTPLVWCRKVDGEKEKKKWRQKGRFPQSSGELYQFNHLLDCTRTGVIHHTERFLRLLLTQQWWIWWCEQLTGILRWTSSPVSLLI